jgi:hypothetical protein
MFTFMPSKYLIPCAYILSFVIATFGVILEIKEAMGVEMWFPRSGALICVVGCLLVIEKTDNLRAHNTFLNELFEHEIVRCMDAVHDGNAKLKVSEAEFRKRMAKSKHETLEKFERGYMKNEAVILISGTLVWGFGDILFTI